MNAVVDIKVIAQDLLETTKRFFIQNGYGAAPLVVMFIGEKDSSLYAAPEGVPPGHLYDTIIQMIKTLEYTPVLICMAMDTYALKIDKEGPNEAWDEADKLRAGDLGRMFRDGDPRVVEQLTVEVLRSGEEVTIGLPYKYTPVDGWEWGEPLPMPEGATSDWDFDRLVAGLPKKSYDELREDL